MKLSDHERIFEINHQGLHQTEAPTPTKIYVHNVQFAIKRKQFWVPKLICLPWFISLSFTLAPASHFYDESKCTKWNDCKHLTISFSEWNVLLLISATLVDHLVMAITGFCNSFWHNYGMISAIFREIQTAAVSFTISLIAIFSFLTIPSTILPSFIVKTFHAGVEGS